MTIQEKVAAIEKFPLEIYRKIDLLLILSEHKLATSITVFGKIVDYKVKQVPEPSRARITAIENLCSRIGLPWVTIPPDIHHPRKHNEQYQNAIVCVGSGEQSVKDVSAVWTNITRLGIPTQSQDAEHGRLSGFPKSAIEAFCVDPDKLLLDNNEAQELTKELTYGNFCNFRLSRRHFARELEIPKQWASTIQKLSPRLYRQITELR